jgi:acyl-CoA-binding protein
VLGDCNTEEPSKLFNYKENAKWNAWRSLKGIKKSDAMVKYCDYSMTLIDKYGIKK